VVSNVCSCTLFYSNIRRLFDKIFADACIVNFQFVPVTVLSANTQFSVFVLVTTTFVLLT
jgi:hypothetical protein